MPSKKSETLTQGINNILIRQVEGIVPLNLEISPLLTGIASN
jgi:hypothetical protein